MYNRPMRSIVRCLTILCGLILMAPCGLAASFLVSQDGSSGHRTIQGAINAASYGDTIYVSAGTYEEHVVLRDGITLIGAGSLSTTIRNTYGFDEALTARNVSSGYIEGFTMERGSSVLSAPVVVLDDATLTIADCVIRRGQDSGVTIRGDTSRPTLSGVSITENDGHGIEVGDRAYVTLRDCAVEANGGSGIVVSDRAVVHLFGGRVSYNKYSGVLVEDEAEGVISGAEFVGNDTWGVFAAGRVSLGDCRFEESTDGAVRCMDHSTVEISGCVVNAGGIGFSCEDQSVVRVTGSRCLNVANVGVRVTDSASLTMSRCELLACGGDGLSVAAGAAADCRHLTVLRCKGNGVIVASDAFGLLASIIAMNEGAGIRVTGSGGLEMSHNNVWGNEGEDYVGTARRPSDMSEAPRFENLGNWDLRLRSDSPGVGDAAGGDTIGAEEDPRAVPGAALRLSVETGDLLPWIEASASVAFDPSTLALDCLEAAGTLGGPGARLSMDARLSGSWGWSGEATAALAWQRSIGENSVSLDLEAHGLSEEGLPWLLASLSGAGRVKFGAGDFAFEYLAEWPTGRTTQYAKAAIGERWRAALNVAAIDWEWTQLALAASARASVAGGEATVGGTLDVGRAAEVVIAWRGPDRRLQASLTSYIDAPETYVVGVDWRESGSPEICFSPHVRIADGGLDQLGLEARVGFSAIDLGVAFGLSAKSEVHIEATFAASLPGLWAPPANRPPVASFTYAPLDLEVGQKAEFDARASADPDGLIQAAFWDFGSPDLVEGLQVEHVFDAPGEYRVVLWIADDQGETTQAEQTITVWPAETRPFASFVWTAVSEAGTDLGRSPRDTDRIRLDASGASDADGAIVEYAWDVDSDGVFEVRTDEPTVVIAPLGLGEHPVTLRVLDDSARTRAVMHVLTVERADPPVAAFDVSPATPSILDPIVFTDRSTDSDGAIIAWQWDFGDGHSARDRDPTHRYAVDGSYEVRLIVTDDSGQSHQTTHVVRVTRVPQVTPIEDVWAVVIGIADYDEVEDLLYAAADAEALAEWLLGQGIAPSHIRLLTDHRGDAAGGRLQSEEATLLAVREALGWLRQNATQDDLVLIHFSGHGFQGIDDDGDEGDGVDEFLVLKDSRESAKEDTALRDDEFGRFIDRIESDHVVIFFDSCYSGGQSRSLPDGARPVGGTPDIFRDFAMEGRLVLSASSEVQEAYESEILEQGVFTHFLLTGLAGEADENADGRLTVWELFTYVSAQVPPFVWQERQAIQQPQLTGEGDTRILLGSGQTLRVEFTFAPPVAYAGGIVQFRDESSPQGMILSWQWSFGDGQVAEVRHPMHVYSEAGTFAVELTVSQENGQTASHRLELTVAPNGEIQRFDSETRRPIVSLGSRNGVVVGDRFSVVDATGAEVGELIVVELLDGDTASCEVVQSRRPLVAGDQLRARF